MGSDPFKGIPGGEELQSLGQGWRWGVTLGRGISVWFLRRRLTSAGYPVTAVEAAVAAAREGKSYRGILAQADEAMELRVRQMEMRKNPPKVFGSARWATLAEARDANLIGNQPSQALRFGTFEKDDEALVWAGESHLLTVAPTRTGKGTTQIIPNLLSYTGSCVVLDPKGELYAATADWRREHVGPVHVLNPFELDAVGQHTDALNPLDLIETDHDATKLAEMIYPRTLDDRQKFFDNEAIGFLSAVLLFSAKYAPPPHRNLGTIRDTISSLNADFYGLTKAMASEGMPNAIRNAAANVLSKTRDVGLPRLIDSLSQHMRIWDTEGLRTATRQSDFDFRSLKDRPTTIYLALPFEELRTYSTYVQIIFAAALDAMQQNPSVPKLPVLFILDEFLALEPSERFVDALRTHASFGARLWFFLQDLPTLEQKYPTTWKSFLQVETKTFFGTDDPHTAELISNYLGEKTETYEIPKYSSATSSSGDSSLSFTISEDIQLTSRRLMKPDEVIEFLSSKDPTKPRHAIHFMRGIRPIRATLIPWFLDEQLVQRLHPLGRS